MMAKKTSVQISGIKQNMDKIEKLTDKLAHSEEVYNFIGKELSNQIKRRTQGRLEEYKQDPISQLTIEARKLLEQAGNSTDKLYRTSVSNLTFSGQLLNSIQYAVNTSAKTIKFFLNDYRYKLLKPTKAQANQFYNTELDKDHNFSNSKFLSEKGLNNKNIDKGLNKKQALQNKSKAYFMLSNQKDEKTNNEIKDDLLKRGRRFFFLSYDLATKVENNLATFIRNNKATLIKKYLNKL